MHEKFETPKIASTVEKLSLILLLHSFTGMAPFFCYILLSHWYTATNDCSPFKPYVFHIFNCYAFSLIIYYNC